MKKTLSALTVFGIAFTMVFLSSCEKAYLVPEEIDIESVSYSSDVQPFFDAKCILCHNGSGIPLDLTSPGSYDALIGGDYIDTDNPTESKLYGKMMPGESMTDYASPSEREMTLAWIKEGANNN
ncbi:MAG: hypothetical protein GXO89_01675 [Chlorobi bacterium]|nr:hypothetical protein [Chlorobiota bacterium]